MATRKTGSRKIVVDEVSYVWRVRPRPTYDQGLSWSPLSVSIALSQSPGTVLVANLDRPRPDNWSDGPSSPLLPSEIADLVRRALAAGWQPGRRGPQFVLSADIGSEAV